MKGPYWLPLVALLAGCSPATYTFAFKPKPGDAATYDMKVSGSMAGQPFNFSGTVKVKVSDGGSGKVKVETVTEGMPTGNKTEIETLDADGKVLSATVDGTEVKDASSGASTRDMLPKQPVKVGDTWSGTRTVSGQTMTAEYKLEKVETVGGVQLATIDITKMEAPDGKLGGPSSVVLEPSTGMMHALNVSLSVTTQGQAITENISMVKK